MKSLADPTDPTRGVQVVKPPPDWKQVLAQAIRSPAELCQHLGLSSSVAADAEDASSGFPLLVPRPYLARIRPGDPCDPLLVQVLPRREEQETVCGFTSDPLGEADAGASPGLLRKYHGRLLIVTTGACAVHCRFCFRRHFPYTNTPRREGLWQSAIERAADPSITEVILSGGDPLTIDDPELARLARRLDSLPHLRRIRLHTRLPIVVPQRVTDELLSWLRAGRITPVVVVHANHPAEIDTSVAAALTRLVDAGVPVLNQSVLLRGVNDNLETLAALCERLIDLRVIPYYLHQLDRAAGTAAFEVGTEKGRELIGALRTRLPGYAVPRYVREIPGTPHKVVLG